MSDEEVLLVNDDAEIHDDLPDGSSTDDMTHAGEDDSKKSEKNKKPHVCNMCGKGYSRKHGLKKHYETHAGVKPFICEVCYKTFSKKCVLNVHSVTHTGERPFACNVCDKRFARKTDLSKHHLTHTGEKPYVCDDCGKGFTHQNNLRKHKIIHTGEKAHVCEVCRQAFARRSVLLNHLKSHYLEDAVTDKDKATKERFRIRNYLSTIIKKNFHPCDMCDKMFVRPDALVKHKLTHKNDSELSHICEICNAKFKDKDKLQEHLLNHVILTMIDDASDCEDEIDAAVDSDIQPLQMSEEKCSTEEQINQPKKKKSKNHHICDICFKSFTRRASLNDHHLTHSGEKPYECTVCQQYFTQKVSLKRHLLIHTGEKYHTCDICQKTFARKTSLRKHYITHSANKLF